MKSPFVSRLFFSLTAVFLTASLLLTYGCLTRVDRNEIILPPAFESAETTAAGTAPADPGSSDPSEAQPVSHVPQTASAPVTAPAVTAPLLTVPVVTSPVPESTSAPITTAPATTSAPITAPVTSAPITTAPVTAPPVTKAPETTAPVTTAEPPAVIPTKPGAAVTYAAADILFTTAHPAASSVSLSSARSIYSLNGWSGNQYFLDGTVSYTWFLSYTEPVWVNEIFVKALSVPSQTALNGVSVYYGSGVPGKEAWQKATVTASLSDGYFRFLLTEAAASRCFMLYMDAPSAEILGNWKGNDNFYGSYDPSPSVPSGPVTPQPGAIKIFVDQGHNMAGYWNAGAQGNGLDEGRVAYNVGIALAALLNRDARFEVKLSRPTADTVLGTDNSSALLARSAAANAWGADYFVSIHCNSASAAAHGIEAYAYSSPSSGYDFGASMLNHLVSVTGFTNRGMKVDPGLSVLNKTVMPAVLVEIGFISNAEEASLMASHPETFAQGLYNGIVAYFFG